ncbi:hypothetical protein evm_006543, partial [Chilo suppressalis]
ASTLLNYGLQGGWISPMTKILQSEASPAGKPLSDAEISWIASTLSIAAVFGVPLYTYISDAYGRRPGVIAMAIPQAMCWAIKLISSNETVLIIARICAGIPAGGCFNLIPMYIKEISQDSIRGKMVSLSMMFPNIGLLTMYSLGAYFDYYTVLWIALSISLVSVVFMWLAPESPGFLVKRCRLEVSVNDLFIQILNISTGINNKVVLLQFLLAGAYIISVLSISCLATIMMLQQTDITVPSWMPVAAIVTTVWAYAAGILPMTYVVMAEVFNFQVRAKLLGLIVTFGWFVSFVQLAIYGAVSVLGLHTIFYIFASINVIGAVVSLLFLPETKGRSVEEIEHLLLGRKIN